MQQLNNTKGATPTLQELIRGLGRRTNVINDAMRMLRERGHEDVAKSTVYSTVRRNGTNNAIIEAALLDAIAAEKAKKVAATARRQALAA